METETKLKDGQRSDKEECCCNVGGHVISQPEL